jgi:hypothetical protein
MTGECGRPRPGRCTSARKPESSVGHTPQPPVQGYHHVCRTGVGLQPLRHSHQPHFLFYRADEDHVASGLDPGPLPGSDDGQHIGYGSGVVEDSWSPKNVSVTIHAKVHIQGVDRVHVGGDHHIGSSPRSPEGGNNIPELVDSHRHTLGLQEVLEVACPVPLHPRGCRDLGDADPLFHLIREILVHPIESSPDRLHLQ